tara:strand:+ start:1130 stop:1627 length:498 start_codon:yes stop_codon:yes gene_type:complete
VWLIFKIDEKKINFFKKEIGLKLNSETIFYSPKILINKYSKNKLIKKEFKVLGDYIFCHNKKFSNLKLLNILKYTKGCKYILNGFLNSQNEINNFIQNFRKLENQEGYVTENFYLLKEKLKYKFKSGPFTDQMFKILTIQKNTFEVLLSNFKITLKKKNLLFEPQ